MKSNSLGIPIAIIFAASIIAAAIYFTGIPATEDTAAQEEIGVEDVSIAPVTAADHILGNPNAPIMIIEYSDFDCPFCKDYHDTLSSIMDEYGSEGNVAWVFRHFPLTQLHPNAARVAEASECVAEFGGNKAFWEFIDLVFTERGTNEPTNMIRLPEFAQTVGVDTNKFNDCFQNRTYKKHVEDSVQEAFQSGGEGTPHTVILVGNEISGTITGAQPYTSIKIALDALLVQIQGGSIQE